MEVQVQVEVLVEVQLEVEVEVEVQVEVEVVLQVELQKKFFAMPPASRGAPPSGSPDARLRRADTDGSWNFLGKF